ncbi:MAG: sialidase, partial [Acidobacteria bacterium]
RRLRGRTHYYTRFAVEPDNENEAYFLSAEFTKTLDGGKTSIDLSGRLAPIGDNHDMWIDPTNGDRFVVAHDDGLSLSINRGRSWHHIQLPVAQMYHVATDNQIPYNVYGNRQDGPSTRGPSNSRLAKQSDDDVSGPIPRGLWHSVAGGESGWAIPDPVDNNIVWASGTGYGSLGGTVERFDERTRQAREVEIWPEATIGVPAADVKYRFNWTFPVAISPHDHNVVYAGSQHVHRTSDGGQSWQVISPDLTLDDKSHQQRSGGLTPDNVGVEYAGVVFAIAESPRERGVIWAGTNDGQLQVTRDNGGRWTNVTAGIPGLPRWGTVSNIEPSRFDNGAAYVTFDLHQVNNRDPFVFREDPVKRGLLYLGTENALYFSVDEGAHWLPLQSGLPHAPVHWLTIQEHFNDLVVATYGRGFYVLDDITPLRTLTPDTLNEAAHLFPPRPAYRFRMITEP